MLKKHNFYMVSDKFFEDFKDPFLKGNKSENRPHYYCLKDENDIYWLIPMTTKIEKVKKLIERQEKKLGIEKCILAYVTIVAGKESGFLIQDMFPIKEEYVKTSYTIDSLPLELKNKEDIKQIDKKARKMLALIKKGKKLFSTQPDVLKIYKELLSKSKDL